MTTRRVATVLAASASAVLLAAGAAGPAGAAPGAGAGSLAGPTTASQGVPDLPGTPPLQTDPISWLYCTLYNSGIETLVPVDCGTITLTGSLGALG